ncbi:MAG: hypothetical protein A2V98_05615 [Planctomycetes bacterium RBG_16_64_12]|nr:MAG: hypothetical protein A2V98_05615 [Planctomycetes bacterium RBG_16_64_12]
MAPAGHIPWFPAQGHTYGLSFWLPFQGTGTYAYEAYSFRSFYLPSFGMGELTPENVAAQKQAYEECRRIAACMLGDYYPLTSYSLQQDHWIAWQFNRPEPGDGVVQAFRRAKCDGPAMTFRLRGLDQSGQYEVTDLDAAAPAKVSGKELMEQGLTVVIKGQPGAAVIVYHRVNGKSGRREGATLADRWACTAMMANEARSAMEKE